MPNWPMRQKAAETLLLKMGITFNVYSRDEGTEKIFPFDIIPRILRIPVFCKRYI